MSHVGYDEVATRVEARVPGLPDSQPSAPLAVEAVAFFEGGTIEVILVRLDAKLTAPADHAQCLSDGERVRASRFVFERDRRRFIVGRARLRHFLASRLGVQPDAVELDYGQRGKPRLSRRFADASLQFNVSHSEDIAVYAFTRGRDIGVDVETVRELRDADEIAAHFFSRGEIEEYLALDPRDKPLGFFNCWTRKEAFIKALGEGLHYPLNRFDVSLAPGEPAKILRVGRVHGGNCGWAIHNFDFGFGVIGAVVVQKLANMPSLRTGSEQVKRRSRTVANVVCST